MESTKDSMAVDADTNTTGVTSGKSIEEIACKLATVGIQKAVIELQKQNDALLVFTSLCKWSMKNISNETDSR